VHGGGGGGHRREGKPWTSINFRARLKSSDPRRGDHRQPAAHDQGRPFPGRRLRSSTTTRAALSGRATAAAATPSSRHFLLAGKTATGRRLTGRSALDAVEITDVATNFLREHLDRLPDALVILEGRRDAQRRPRQGSVWYLRRHSDEQIEAMYEASQLRQGRRPGSGRNSFPYVSSPPSTNSTATKRPRALSEEHRARRHARLDGRGKRFCQGLQKSSKPRRRACRPSHAATRSAGQFLRRWIVRRGRRDARRSDGHHFVPGQVPGTIATTGLPWLQLRLDGLERLNAGAKAIAAQAIDLLTKARGAEKAADGVRSLHQDHALQAVSARGRQTAPFLNEELDGNASLMEKAEGEIK